MISYGIDTFEAAPQAFCGMCLIFFSQLDWVVCLKEEDYKGNKPFKELVFHVTIISCHIAKFLIILLVFQLSSL